MKTLKKAELSVKMLTLTSSKLKILEILKGSPRTHKEIYVLLKKAKSTISEHLRDLISHNLIIRENKYLKLTNYGLDLYKKSSEKNTEQKEKVPTFSIGGANITEQIPNKNNKKQISHKEGLKVLNSEEELFNNLSKKGDENIVKQIEGVPTFPVGGANGTEQKTEQPLGTAPLFTSANQKSPKTRIHLSGIKLFVLESLGDCESKGIYPSYSILTKNYHLTKRQARHHRTGLIKLKLISGSDFRLTDEGKKLVKTPNFSPAIYGRGVPNPTEQIGITEQIQTPKSEKKHFEFEGRLHNYIITVAILKEPINKDWYLKSWKPQTGMMRGKDKKQIWYSCHFKDIHLLYTNKNIVFRFPEAKYKDINIGLSELNVMVNDICTKLQHENKGLKLGKFQIVSQQSVAIQNTPISQMAKKNNFTYRDDPKKPHSIEIDHSHGTPEMETTNAVTAHNDYYKYVEHTKDIISNPNVAKLSEIQNTLNSTVRVLETTGNQNQKFTKENQNIMTQVIMSQKITVESLSSLMKIVTPQQQTQKPIPCDIDPKESNVYQ